MLPVFGGISGRTRTTLNTTVAASLRDALGGSLGSELQFARYKFFEFHNIGGEFANTFCCLFRRHRILIE